MPLDAEKFLKGTNLSKKKIRCIETSIHKQHIVDQVSAFLHATSIINDNEEITNIEFGDLSKRNLDLVPIKIYFRGG